MEKAKVNNIECRAIAIVSVDKIDISTVKDMVEGHRKLINGPKSFSGEVEVPEKLDPEGQHLYEGVFSYNGEKTKGKGTILVHSDPVENHGVWQYTFEGTGKPKLEKDIIDG